MDSIELTRLSLTLDRMIQSIFNRIIIILIWYHITLTICSKSRFPNHQIKANNKMQSLNSFKNPAIVKKSIAPVKINKNENSDDDVGSLPRIEIYVRKFSVGLWIRLAKKSIHCGFKNGDVTSDNDTTVINMFKLLESNNNEENTGISGIEEEQLRDEIDKWITSRLFSANVGFPAAGGITGGLGGERHFIQQVQVLLPQFKKLKPKEFEFGYKYVSLPNNQTIDSNAQLPEATSVGSSVIYSLISSERQRINSKIATATSDVDLLNNSADYSTKYNDILRYYSQTFYPNETMTYYPSNTDGDQKDKQLNISTVEINKHINSYIDEITDMLLHDKFNHLDVFFDGSAYFMKPQNKLQLSDNITENSKNNSNTTLFVVNKCVKASAGVFIVPGYKQKVKLLKNNDYDDNILFDFDTNTNQNKIESCSHNDKNWSIYSHSASYLVTTPFDAELFAGLVAITLIRCVLQKYILYKRNNDDKQITVPSITFFTDSKTMIKVFRNINAVVSSSIECHNKSTVGIHSYSDSYYHQTQSVNIEPSEYSYKSDGGLYSRGEGLSRQILWDVITNHVKYIHYALQYSHIRNEDTDVNQNNNNYEQISQLVRWISGHPERTKTKNEWNLYDKGIWTADEIARSGCSSITCSSTNIIEDNAVLNEKIIYTTTTNNNDKDEVDIKNDRMKDVPDNYINSNSNNRVQNSIINAKNKFFINDIENSNNNILVDHRIKSMNCENSHFAISAYDLLLYSITNI